jgi:glycosyltransferase involved in cell wall biosynthesis
MRVLLLSKALVVGAYQRKLEEIAACPDVELTAAVPPAWRDERGLLSLERAYLNGYRLVVTPMRFNGHFHLHYYPELGRLIRDVQPDVVHLDEEPYNLATWHAARGARRAGAQIVVFTWQNLLRRYPWPFGLFERAVLRQTRVLIAGNAAAVAVWRAKGYTGPLPVIPQFGVDPEFFRPRPVPDEPAAPGAAPFVVGFAGRLVPEKGVDLLLRAVAQLPAAPQPAVQVRLIGAGPERERLLALAEALGLGGRVSVASVPSLDMPVQLAALDCLVLPSRSRPNWQEQFGRVLIEAMACGVPVIGSTCGELPNVIGPDGLVFPEGDLAALAGHLRALWQDPGLRAGLGARGRARVLERYTQRQIAQATVAVWRAAVGQGFQSQLTNSPSSP